MSVPPEQSDKLLTQADIDALLGKGAAKRPAAPAASSAEPVAAAPTEPVAPKIIPNINVKTVRLPPLPGSPASPAAAAGQPAFLAPRPSAMPSPEIKILRDQITSLTDRLAQLEVVTAKDNQNTEVATNLARNDAQSAHAQVMALAQQVAAIKQALESTAGYNMAKTFHCTSCGTVGVVAIPVRCNKCGKTNWWGWWPKKK